MRFISLISQQRKTIAGFILSLISSVAMAHSGHGSHSEIIASGDLHPFIDTTGLILLVMVIGLGALYLLRRRKKVTVQPD